MGAGSALVLELEDAAPGSQSRHRLAEGEFSIGRGAHCDWVLEGTAISRLHVLIRCLGGLWFVEDRSTNGILINARPLAGREPATLRDGDVLQIDVHRIRVAMDGAMGSPAPMPEPVVDSVLQTQFTALPGTGIPGLGVSGSLIPDPDADADSAVALDPLRWLDAGLPASSRGLRPLPGVTQAPVLSEHIRLSAPAPREGPAELPEHWDSTRSLFNLPVASVAPVPGAEAEREATAALLAGERSGALSEVGTAAVVSHEAPAATARSGNGSDAAAATGAADARLAPLFHAMVEGVMDVLRARAQLKSGFRLPVTLIQRRENNPLKFAATADEAIQRLLDPPGTAYLDGRAAIEDAMDDIRHHQLAVLAGVRAAFDHFLQQFDPGRFRPGDAPAWQPERWRQSTAWRVYQAHFDALASDRDGSFRRLFGDAFGEAYDQQFSALKATRGRHAPAQDNVA